MNFKCIVWIVFLIRCLWILSGQGTGPCRPEYRKCNYSDICVPAKLWCNGYRNCGPGDNSDQSKAGPCRQGYRRCNIYKQCFPSEYWCDRQNDCGLNDDTDEPSDCACPELQLKNGSLSSECWRHRNESCEIICNSGYLPKNGSSSITCGLSYQWSWNLDGNVCEAILCPEVEIKNVTLPPKCLLLANHTCEFKCDAGFTPKGSSTSVTCGPMGKWMEDIEDVCEDNQTSLRSGNELPLYRGLLHWKRHGNIH